MYSFVKLIFKDNYMIGLTILFKMDMQNFSKIEQNIKVSMLPAPAGNMLTPFISCPIWFKNILIPD